MMTTDEDLVYLLVVGHWQPRPNGWYEKHVTFYYENGLTVDSYTVDGSGHGPSRTQLNTVLADSTFDEKS